jgi:hypothetical protein
MMRATDFACLFLGRPADHLHHPTGRDADGRYLDPNLVAPLSRSMHVGEHQGWRALGIGEGSRAAANVLRARRLAHLLVRMGEHHGIGVVVLPASMVREMGKVLHRIADDSGGGQ